MRSNSIVNMSNLDKIKFLKKRAEELSGDYHESIERLKFYDKDVEFMMKRLTTLDQKIDRIAVNYKPVIDLSIKKKGINSIYKSHKSKLKNNK